MMPLVLKRITEARHRPLPIASQKYLGKAHPLHTSPYPTTQKPIDTCSTVNPVETASAEYGALRLKAVVRVPVVRQV